MPDENDPVSERNRLQAKYGPENVWDASEVSDRFDVIAIASPYCIVKRRFDQALGSIQFQYCPRFYFNFTPEADN